jgi:hypothetical protein
LAALKRTAARRVALAILFLAVALVVTLTGFYLSWTQIHSPRPNALLGVALIWPYAIVNWIFHAILGPEPLPTRVYYLAFALGSVAQLSYLFGILSLARFMVSAALSRSRPDTVRQGDDRPHSSRMTRSS